MAGNTDKSSRKTEREEYIPDELWKKISDKLLKKNRKAYEMLAQSDTE